MYPDIPSARPIRPATVEMETSAADDGKAYADGTVRLRIQEYEGTH